MAINNEEAGPGRPRRSIEPPLMMAKENDDEKGIPIRDMLW